jgi:dTDP-4-dehydrorhamnose reductase
MGKILILGSKGMLGQELVRVFGNDAIGWDRSDVDVADGESLKLKVGSLKPSVIINCVAYNDVDGAEDNREAAMKMNAEVPGNLAAITKDLDITLVHFSTNYVFDGAKGEYQESDGPHPLSIYAESKYQGELAVQKNTGKFYIIRTAVIFGPKGESALSKRSFVGLMLDLSAKSDTIKAVSDEVNSITYAADLATAVKGIIGNRQPYGIYHFTNSGSASWYDLAKEIFAITGKQINVLPVPSSAFPRKAKRPAKSILLNTKLPPLRPWQEALKEYLTSL